MSLPIKISFQSNYDCLHYDLDATGQRFVSNFYLIRKLHATVNIRVANTKFQHIKFYFEEGGGGELFWRLKIILQLTEYTTTSKIETK